MAFAALSTKAVGSIVKLKVNGVLRNFIVVQKGRPSTAYDASCDGVWLLMGDVYSNRQWHSDYCSEYANSNIHSYLNGTFLGLFDSDVQAQIKQAKIPYCPNRTTVNNGADGLSTKIFLLSYTEVGISPKSDYPVVGAALDYFKEGTDARRIAKLNDVASDWWLRDPYFGSVAYWVQFVTKYGSNNADYGKRVYGVRPALILPSSFLVYENSAPATPTSINVPSTIQGGSTITVSWSTATDAEDNLEGYKVERSTDGGSTWIQVYQGNAQTATNTVAFGTATVMYRVQAYDSEGLSSAYRTSAQVTVINNHAPSVPASITIPNEVIGGKSLTVTWGAATDADGDLAGYSLERQIDGGSTWTEVYKGGALSYTDTVTRGWASVCYRVRAYDSHGAYGGYTTTQSRTVNNNIAPILTCTQSSGVDLGVKDGGFTIAYSVEDPDGDEVTVTEAIDGVEKRIFKPEPGASNSFAVTGEYFMCLLNGKHTMTITATDGKGSTVHTLTFTKEIHKATITLAEPLDADAQIEICVLSVIGSLPVDAKFTVEVTNNAKDDNPVWEDCTAEARAGANHVFENTTAVNGFAFNFMIKAERGPSGEGGYISSAQGGFQ